MLLILEWMSSLVLLENETEIIYKAEGELSPLPHWLYFLISQLSLPLFSPPISFP